MLFDDFPECPQSLVNGFGIGEHSGDIVVKFHEDGKIVLKYTTKNDSMSNKNHRAIVFSFLDLTFC